MILAYLRLTGALLVAFARDRSALAWGFLLPLLLIFLFGSLSGGEDTTTRIPIGVVTLDPKTTRWIPDTFAQMPLFETSQGTLSEETRALQTGQCRLVVVFPTGFGMKMQMSEPAKVRLLYNPAQSDGGQGSIALSVARQVIAGINQRLSGQPALLDVQEETVLSARGQTNTVNVRGFDFVLPGLIGLTTLQLGLFTAVPFITMRQKGILKRLRATPLPRFIVVGSQISQRLLINLTQTVLILTTAVLGFHFHVACSPLVLMGVLAPGTLLFIAIGMLLSGAARTEEAGASLVQVVNLPLLLFSGLLIPTDILPQAVQPVRWLLPTTYFGEALREVLTGAAGSHSLLFNMAVLGGWLIVSFSLAVRFFRWE